MEKQPYESITLAFFFRFIENTVAKPACASGKAASRDTGQRLVFY
jgi:hypothetical protein